MDEPLTPSGALPLLAELFRSRRSGVLTLGSSRAGLHILLRDGQVAGLGPAASPPAHPRPDESAATRLERVLQEVGIRRPAPGAAPPPAPAPSGVFREKVLDALVDPDLPAAFVENAPAPPHVAEAAGATEPFILEAVRRMRGHGPVQALLGDLDRPLLATAALAGERTLTLTEGYILSRIDGLSTARQVLELVPLDPDDTRRTLLGLLLTGRVETRPALPPRERPDAAPEPAVSLGPGLRPASADAPAEAPAEVGEAARADAVGQASSASAEAQDAAFPFVEPHGDPRQEAMAAADAETMARRQEVLAIFQSLPLKNHFEVLGLKPGCTDADVRRAYVGLAKRFHPDAHRDPRLADLHDVLEAVFIRVGEAWEVLGDAKSRASYEARFGARGPSPGRGGAAASSAPAARAADDVYVPPEETLLKAQLLLAKARYWDAIQMLETAIPLMEPRRHQLRGRILLARAYAKNPNWKRKAEEQLQDVVREDPANVDAHYELGLLYKAGGLPARAQAMFRRVLELRPDHRDAVAELGPAENRASGGLFKRLFGRGGAS